MRWSIDFGYGKSAGQNDLIVNLDENRVVARVFEFQAMNVVDQVDPVMRTGRVEIAVDDDPRIFVGHGDSD